MTAHRSDPYNSPEEDSSHSKPNPDGCEHGPEPLDRKHFQEPADRWEDETLFLSSSRQAAEFPGTGTRKMKPYPVKLQTGG